MSTRAGFLIQKLGTGVFTPQEDAAEIDFSENGNRNELKGKPFLLDIPKYWEIISHHPVKHLVFHLVNLDAFYPKPGIIDDSTKSRQSFGADGSVPEQFPS